MQRVRGKLYLFSIILTLGAGYLVSLISKNSRVLYESTYKPPFAPPGFLFPLVWTILYILMGIAAARIAASNTVQKKEALILYGAQLFVNALWTIIYFNLDMKLLAFAWLLLLLYLVLLTYRAFHQIDITAARLLLPYIVWLLFAGYLNLAIAINEFIV